MGAFVRKIVLILGDIGCLYLATYIAIYMIAGTQIHCHSALLEMMKGKSFGWHPFATFLMFLTKGRTGFILHCGELVLLFVALVYLRKKKFWKRCSIIFLCSAIAFVGSNLFMGEYMNKKEVMGKDKRAFSLMQEYVDNNAVSLANPDRRSNRARYSIMKADLRIGLDHMLFGVGRGLRNAYIPDYLDEKALSNGEIKMWISFREKLGVLKFGFPKLGEYTSRFSETGLFGFLLPSIILIFAYLKK